MTPMGLAPVVAAVSFAVRIGLGASSAQSAPIEWADVVESYGHVHDYTTLYDKQERAISNGEIQHIRLSFRKPLEVRLEWLDDNGKVDQIAVYRQGFNGGKLLARRIGKLGSLIGTLRLDPLDSRALQDSRHPITEVGLGYIIDRIAQVSRNERVNVRPAVEDVLEGEPGYRFEVDAPADVPIINIDGACRATAWVGRTLKLPIRVDISNRAGVLLERHRFKNIRINVGLTDATFTL